MNSKFILRTLAAALFSISLTVQAAMVEYSFERVTNNNVEDLSSQLSIKIWDWSGANNEFGTLLTSNAIFFTVHNAVGTDSAVSEVYFDDGLLGPSIVHNSLGGFTDFTGGGANPGNLPGGNTIGFVATQLFSADAQGNPSKGVNTATDILGIELGLGGFADYDAVVAAVNSGDLRFGYHIRAVGVADDSDSYASVVPVPAAMWLFGSALMGLTGMRKYQNK
nr:hypothetical protein [uncultured bacterium]